MKNSVLGRGQYLGSTLYSRACGGLLLTLCSYGRESKFPKHVHENPGFFYLIEGDHQESRDDVAIVQPAGTAVFHSTSDHHSTEIGPAGMMGMNISLDRTWLRTIGESAGSHPTRFTHMQCTLDVEALRLIIRAMALESDSDQVAGMALELLSHLECSSDDQMPSWLRRSRDRILCQFNERLSLMNLAEDAGVHPTYFARTFRRHFGASVYEYLHQVRIQYALQLIRQGCSLGEAAAASGFSDQAHLTRICKAKLELTPGWMRAFYKRVHSFKTS